MLLFTITGITAFAAEVTAGTASDPAGSKKSFSASNNATHRASQANHANRLIVELRSSPLAQ
ncbi:MAG TPA: hypothetical protein ENN66_09655 [Proteobacteria bacterium]|nr:hypothetical protein [Pseudomonadota bacterium]